MPGEKRSKNLGMVEGCGEGRDGGSVGTISADACSYAVRILLSRTEIPAGFLRSLSSRAAARGQRETKQGRNVGGWNAMGNGHAGEVGRGRVEPVFSSGHGPPTIFARRGVMKSSNCGEPVGYISRSERGRNEER